MGQEESRVAPEQVTGFNPDVENTRRRNARNRQHKVAAAPAIRPERRTSHHPQAATTQIAAFFRHVDIADHIRPVYDDGRAEHIAEELEADAPEENLTKLLGELGIKGKETDSDNELRDFDTDHLETESSSSDDDDEDRGMFHHEVENIESTEVSIYSSEAHPISVKGDYAVAERLVCKDQSGWAVQCPIYKIEWFIGTDINAQSIFNAHAAADGSSFVVPASAVGRYIQVVATRRVENQVRDTYGHEVEGGVFDPHVQRAAHVETGTERTFTDVSSTVVVGPILIPDSWSFAILKSLHEGSFECGVKLRDEVIQTNEEPDSNQDNGILGELVEKVPAVLRVNWEHISFMYEINEKNRRAEGASSMFSFEWLKKLIGRDSSKTEGKNTTVVVPVGLVTAQFRVKSVYLRPSKAKRTIVLATKLRKKGFSHTAKVQDLIRFDVDPGIGRDVVFYVLLAFQAAHKFHQNQKEYWDQVFENGEVERGKDLIQRYLEVLTQSTTEDALAYEEIPLSPWDY